MIIDTNFYSALDKGEAAAKEIVRAQSTIKMPIYVIAELKLGFSYGAREELNKENLNRFLSLESVSLLTPKLDTTEIYADLASYCRRNGRVLSQNDLWIAALAKEYDEVLVTFDQDFEAIRDYLGGKLIVLDEL